MVSITIPYYFRYPEETFFSISCCIVSTAHKQHIMNIQRAPKQNNWNTYISTLLVSSSHLGCVYHPIWHMRLISLLCDVDWKWSIDDKKSGKLNTKFGVPQGSILGPVLFNLYVADLADQLSTMCSCHQYADETKAILNSLAQTLRAKKSFKTFYPQAKHSVRAKDPSEQGY